MAKIVKSFRFSEATSKELEAMAKRLQLGQAETIAMLIHAANEIGFADEEKFDDMVQLARRI